MLIALGLCARIRLRMGASTEVAAGVITRPDWTAAVSKSGVLQGGELAGGEESPVFVVKAEQDSRGAPLQRLQIIKGWYAGGRKQDAVFDIAWSDELTVAPDHRCPYNSASARKKLVDEASGEIETVYPSYLGSQDTFYVGAMKSVDRVYQHTFESTEAGANYSVFNDLENYW